LNSSYFTGFTLATIQVRIPKSDQSQLQMYLIKKKSTGKLLHKFINYEPVACVSFSWVRF